MREKKDRKRAVVCPGKKEVCTFVFSFVFSVGEKSLLYDSEIWCIELWVLSFFSLHYFFIPSLVSEFLHDCLRTWTYLTLREPCEFWCSYV